MPKSEILLLRRWPCWPGPYSRRLTGLLGRPKTFSPMRRSSLYLALVRLVTSISPICLFIDVRTAPRGLLPRAIAASPDVRDQLRTAHLGGEGPMVKVSRARVPDRRARG